MIFIYNSICSIAEDGSGKNVVYQYLLLSTQFSLHCLELFLHLIWFLTIVLNKCPAPVRLSSHGWLLPMQVPVNENKVSSSLVPFSLIIWDGQKCGSFTFFI